MSAEPLPLPPPRLLSTQMVACLLEISPRTVEEMIKRGDFKEVVYVTSRDRRISEDVYREFLTSRTVATR
jgi:Mn-dependent DtxR family transcriptional regulator